jgi:hypothetical protein
MSEQQQRSSLPPQQLGGEDQGEQLAQEIAEAPERLRRRPDIAQTLTSMRRGVLVELRITRPRFTVALTNKRKPNNLKLGPEGLGLVFSEDVERVLADYFTLGRHSLLPKEWQESLNAAETSARRCLADASVRTHWGAFVPAGAYKDWHEANERYKQQFLDLKERILSEYDEMRATVEEDYRRLAEEAWAHTTFGKVALQSHNGSVSPEMVADLSHGLTDEEAHQTFIDHYMAVIESLIPTHQQLEEAFEYETDLSYIPLPSQLDAVTHAQGEEQQTLQNEAQLGMIEARAEATSQAIEAEEQALVEAKRRNELAEAEMQSAVIENAQRQKEKLIAEFYVDVVAYINNRIAQVCARTLESLGKNNNMLRGPVADSLRDLVTMMENLNIVEDKQLEDQINQLRAALPTQEERDSAKSGAARIDTTRIQTVVRAMEEQAEQTLLELNLNESPRTRRAKPLTLDQDTLLTDERRATRTQASALPAELASSRRSRSNKTK